MHEESLNKMAELLRRYVPEDDGNAVRVLDIGSRDINGTYRPLVEEKGWKYTGLDFSEGPNVDIVTIKPYKFPLAAGDFNVVICGNMLNNVPAPWKLIPEMVRVLQPGGLLVVVSIWRWGVSAYPTDYHRWLDAGLRVLLEEPGKLENIKVGQDDLGNSWASGFKE